MSDIVWVAIITAIPGTLAAVFSVRANQNAKRARTQVENNHDTNLREESDERHVENKNFLTRIILLIKRDVLDRLESMQDDITYLRSYGHENRQRIEEIENTQDRSPFAPQGGRHAKE